jgi:hypothetical protein
VQVHVQLNQTQVTAIDNATLQLGAAPVAYAPLHPTEDLARCQRYYWYVGGDDAAEIVGHGMAVSATQVFGWLKFPVQMAGVPTMTVSAPALWGVMGAGGGVIACTALAFGSPTPKGVRFSATTAGGLTAGDGSQLMAQSTSARISAEVNP